MRNIVPPPRPRQGGERRSANYARAARIAEAAFVLWANLIAWPLGGFLLQRWLQGFSARISLSPTYFLAAGGAAAAIALITVSVQALRVSRAEPARALRYE